MSLDSVYRKSSSLESNRKKLEEAKKQLENPQDDEQIAFITSVLDGMDLYSENKEIDEKKNNLSKPIDMQTSLEGKEIIYGGDSENQPQNAEEEKSSDIEIDFINDNMRLVTYHLPSGESQIEVCSISITESEKRIINRLLNDHDYVEEVMTIHENPGEMFHGYPEFSKINSTSCFNFYEQYLEILKVLIKLRELFKTTFYITKDEEKLKEIRDYDNLIKLFFSNNQNNIVPVWNGEKDVNGEKYEGADIYSIFDGREKAFDEVSRRVAAQERLCFALASGCSNFEIGLDQFGNSLKEDEILAFYGSEALEKYRAKVNSKKVDEPFVNQFEEIMDFEGSKPRR